MNQIQLTDTQAVILSAACARDDALVFPVTAKIKGGAVGNVCKSLLKRGLIEEIPAADPNSVWRHDEETGPITLRATSLAYSALGISDDDQAKDGVKHRDRPKAPTTGRRKDSKQAQLIAMLKRAKGATIDEIAEALDWQHHTVRGAMAGALKKRLGLEITSEKVEKRGRVYRVAG